MIVPGTVPAMEALSPARRVLDSGKGLLGLTAASAMRQEVGFRRTIAMRRVEPMG
jgi:hypothetical protein